MELLTHLIDAANDKHPLSIKRSSKWPTARKKHLRLNPVCAVCGGEEKLEVHHIVPFHNDPTKELDPSNLITLCEGNKNINCHLVVGHSFSYKTFNPNVREDAKMLSEHFAARVENKPNETASG